MQLNWSQDMAPRLSEHHHGFRNDYYWVALHGIYKRDVNSCNLGQMFGLQRPNNLLVQWVTGKLNWQIWFRKTISATSQGSLTNYAMFSVVLCMNRYWDDVFKTITILTSPKTNISNFSLVLAVFASDRIFSFQLKETLSVKEKLKFISIEKKSSLSYLGCKIQPHPILPENGKLKSNLLSAQPTIWSFKEN